MTLCPILFMPRDPVLLCFPLTGRSCDLCLSAINSWEVELKGRGDAKDGKKDWGLGWCQSGVWTKGVRSEVWVLSRVRLFL